MKYNYLKQAWNSLRQQPVVSTVSVIGTALAIALIMVVVMLEEVKVAPFAPESNRDRWLVQTYASITNDNWSQNASSNGPMSYTMIKEIFYKMETPEAVTAVKCNPETASVAIPEQPSSYAALLEVDDRFWNVMDFTFIAGKPFTRADFDSGLTVAVVNESVARRLYNTTDIVGREILINYVPYRVSGVVKDVSSLATVAFADVWIPFTATNTTGDVWCDYMGSLCALILARDKSDFPAIREEYNRLFDKFEDETKLNGWSFIRRNRPYTQKVAAHSPWANVETDMNEVYKQQLVIYLILLLIPAINLSSMTHSRLRRRHEEIGVRRAFGATRRGIMRETFIENLVITVFAGIIGLVISVLFAYIAGGTLFAPEYSPVATTASNLNFHILMHWSTFGMALLFSFILNLLSAGIPSWHASRTDIVNALSGKH